MQADVRVSLYEQMYAYLYTNVLRLVESNDTRKYEDIAENLFGELLPKRDSFPTVANF